MPDWTPEQVDKIEQILIAIKENQTDIKETQKILNDLVVVIKGYNGFKGIAQIVQESTGQISTLQSCFDGFQKVPELVTDLEAKMIELKNIPKAVKDLEEKVIKVQNRPGDIALKWFTRIGVALLSAVCIALISYFFAIGQVTSIKIVDPNTSNSYHVVPKVSGNQNP